MSRRLSGRRRGKQAVVEPKLLQEVVAAAIIDASIPVHGRTFVSATASIKVAGSHGIRKRLHDLAVVSRVELAQIVAVQQVHTAFLAGGHTKVENGARLIGQQHKSAGAQINVVVEQKLLIERREVVGRGKSSTAERELDHRIAVIFAASVGIEGPITGHYVDIAVVVG